MGPLALSIRYSVRLLSNSGVAGELRYLGPSPSSSRPPSPTAWPFWSRIGKRTRARNLSMTPRPRWLGLARPTSTSSSGRMSRLACELAGHLVPAGRRPAELVRLDRLVGEAAALEVGERAPRRPSSRSGPRGRRRSRYRGPGAGAPGGRPRAWSARRSRRRPCGQRAERLRERSAPSRSMTKLKMSPPRPQPKQCQRLAGRA